MAKPPPKCKGCDMILKWLPWTGTPSRPVEPSGKEHNCTKYQRSTKESMYNVDIWTTFESRQQFNFCGRCKTLCETDKDFGQWCVKCEMYPQVTFSGKDETDNNCFEANPKVTPLQITNKIEIMEKYRGKNSDAPTNWMHMNDDGIMKNGYKLTSELTKWYEEGGKSILIDMYSKIWYKVKEKTSIIVEK